MLIRLECVCGSEPWVNPKYIKKIVPRHCGKVMRICVYVDTEDVTTYFLATEYATYDEAVDACDDFASTVNAVLKSPSE